MLGSNRSLASEVEEQFKPGREQTWSISMYHFFVVHMTVRYVLRRYINQGEGFVELSLKLYTDRLKAKSISRDIINKPFCILTCLEPGKDLFSIVQEKKLKNSLNIFKKPPSYYAFES